MKMCVKKKCKGNSYSEMDSKSGFTMPNVQLNNLGRKIRNDVDDIFAAKAIFSPLICLVLPLLPPYFRKGKKNAQFLLSVIL